MHYSERTLQRQLKSYKLNFGIFWTNITSKFKSNLFKTRIHGRNCGIVEFMPIKALWRAPLNVGQGKPQNSFKTTVR
jgi:hypothetical protein